MSISVGSEQKYVAEPNVVPLCDVLLVLLIIFMIVTPMIRGGPDVRIPSALNTMDMPENPEVVMYIQKDGTLWLNTDKVTLEQLQSKLEEAFLTAQDKKLYLRADQELEYGKIVDLIDIVRESGVEIVGIITQKKAEKAG
ncbi:MAG TPA: biopolymer transporter ExbD [Acidobacteriota bacterium]